MKLVNCDSTAGTLTVQWPVRSASGQCARERGVRSREIVSSISYICLGSHLGTRVGSGPPQATVHGKVQRITHHTRTNTREPCTVFGRASADERPAHVPTAPRATVPGELRTSAPAVSFFDFVESPGQSDLKSVHFLFVTVPYRIYGKI